MSGNEGLMPSADAEMKIPEAPRTEQEIVADVMDRSIVVQEDFAIAMADLAMHDLRIAPNKTYFTIHDVRQVAQASARTAIRVARALVGPPDDLVEFESRIANNETEGEV